MPYNPKLVFCLLPAGLGARGGIGQAVRNLLAAWAGNPQAPSVRVVDSWGVIWKVRRSAVSPLYFVGAICLIVGARLRGRLALLHLNMAGGGSAIRKCLLVWLGRALLVPVVVHVHASQIADQVRGLPRPVQSLLRCTLNRARFVIVLGSFWQRFFVEELGVDAHRVVTIRYGVPSSPKQPSGPPSRPGPTCRLLFLGLLGERKATPEVLRALAAPRLSDLDWHAVFAGDGPVDAMRTLTRQLGIEARCTFTGWVGREKVAQLLTESDALVLPSRQEGLPVAILEAMAYGLAIVTSPAGAIEDAITDGDTGLLVPSGDVDRLADALLRLVSSPQLRLRLGRAAQDKQQREFTLERYAREVLDLYRRCGVEPTEDIGELPRAEARRGT